MIAYVASSSSSSSNIILVNTGILPDSSTSDRRRRRREEGGVGSCRPSVPPLPTYLGLQLPTPPSLTALLSYRCESRDEEEEGGWGVPSSDHISVPATKEEEEGVSLRGGRRSRKDDGE